MEDKHTCTNCQHELDVGVDAFKVKKGVIGVRDFVELEEPMFFCGESCLGEYFDLSDLPSLPRRIP
jgi:hypothetical protein